MLNKELSLTCTSSIIEIKDTLICERVSDPDSVKWFGRYGKQSIPWFKFTDVPNGSNIPTLMYSNDGGNTLSLVSGTPTRTGYHRVILGSIGVTNWIHITKGEDKIQIGHIIQNNSPMYLHSGILACWDYIDITPPAQLYYTKPDKSVMNEFWKLVDKSPQQIDVFFQFTETNPNV